MQQMVVEGVGGGGCDVGGGCYYVHVVLKIQKGQTLAQ
jgi:hypothetical protein